MEWFLIGCLTGLFLITFLLGSIPWGVVISRVFYGRDIRNGGSGNIGATNALRTLGRAGGAAVFVLDFGKGLAAGAIGAVASVWISGNVAMDVLDVHVLWADLWWCAWESWLAPMCMAIAFAGCTWGHIFSPWLGFKGGKGIAVAAGALFFVFGPVGGVVELVVFAAFVALTRYVSVGSIAAAVACPILALYFYWGHWVSWAIIFAVAATVVWAHRANIARLRTHTESRLGSIGDKAESGDKDARP